MYFNKSWENFIKNSRYFDSMIEFVEHEANLCPSKNNVFRFMNNDLKKVKCIILGMDPYYSTYNKDGLITPVATGRAFEVANIENFTDKYKQQSLSNIFKSLCYYKFGKIYSMTEIRKEYILDKIYFKNIHRWFDKMEGIGVLFLNATLTTVIGKPGAHIDKWKNFMDELISYIEDSIDCKWLIWGKVALERVNNLVNNNNIVYSCHPASRYNNNFVEDCCFKKINNIEWF